MQPVGWLAKSKRHQGKKNATTTSDLQRKKVCAASHNDTYDAIEIYVRTFTNKFSVAAVRAIVVASAFAVVVVVVVATTVAYVANVSYSARDQRYASLLARP